VYIAHSLHDFVMAYVVVLSSVTYMYELVSIGYLDRLAHDARDPVTGSCRSVGDRQPALYGSDKNEP